MALLGKVLRKLEERIRSEDIRKKMNFQKFGNTR